MFMKKYMHVLAFLCTGSILADTIRFKVKPFAKKKPVHTQSKSEQMGGCCPEKLNSCPDRSIEEMTDTTASNDCDTTVCDNYSEDAMRCGCNKPKPKPKSQEEMTDTTACNDCDTTVCDNYSEDAMRCGCNKPKPKPKSQEEMTDTTACNDCDTTVCDNYSEDAMRCGCNKPKPKPKSQEEMPTRCVKSCSRTEMMDTQECTECNEGTTRCACNITIKPKPKKDQKMMKETRTTTASGLQYVVIKAAAADAKKVKKGTKVEVHYTGWLVDSKTGMIMSDKKFDSSRDRNQTLPVTAGMSQVIAGFDEALMGMAEGDRRMIYIPAELGYGSRSIGSMIPANSMLAFDLELVKVY
jgi:FKBP-type peptidyl-prolyl cis-trans isomerase